MSEASSAPPAASDRAIWARPDAFDEAPDGWGWLDPSGRQHAVKTAADLLEIIGGDLDGRVILVWSPETERMILPEELEGAEEPVASARSRRLQADASDSGRRLRWVTAALVVFALHLLWQFWTALPQAMEFADRLIDSIHLLRHSSSLGLAVLGWLVFAFIPWYQSRKALKEWRSNRKMGAGPLIPALRFDTWLDLQRAPITRILAALLLVVWLSQWMEGASAIRDAGLVKTAYQAGEWWRLLTAPWLHGNLIHLVLNALALLYLGKRVELFARWPHLLAVLLFASLAGGVVSAHAFKATSVGISGGLMGWLGFLLVFESLHRELVPRSSRRRLLGGLMLTALIGLLGYRFIDNAAHLGGLMAGIAYAWIVFPPSASFHRPRVLWIDRLAGAAAGLLLVAAVALTLWRIWMV